MHKSYSLFYSLFCLAYMYIYVTPECFTEIASRPKHFISCWRLDWNGVQNEINNYGLYLNKTKNKRRKCLHLGNFLSQLFSFFLSLYFSSFYFGCNFSHYPQLLTSSPFCLFLYFCLPKILVPVASLHWFFLLSLHP